MEESSPTGKAVSLFIDIWNETRLESGAYGKDITR